jgi:hypothetical protein
MSAVKVNTSSFVREYFDTFGRTEHLRLAQLLNELEYNQQWLTDLLVQSDMTEKLTDDEAAELRRAITLIEEKLSTDNLKRMPRWFWDDSRFYADPRHPDFVVNNNSSSLKQVLMDDMFTNASNAFLQRSTFFDKRSLNIF